MVKKDSNAANVSNSHINNINNNGQKKNGNVLGNCNRELNLSPQRIYVENKDRDGMTGEDLKLEMLKLPIFQNKKSLDLLEGKFQQRNSHGDGKNNLIEGLKMKEIK